MRHYGLALAVLLSTVLLSSSDRPFTIRDKAYFADPALVNFVRPGLVTKILSAQIAQDGTIQVRFRLTDPRGLPLDRTGVTTPGAVSTSFIAAVLPNDQSQYVAYTVRTETDAASGRTATQATADAGGTYAQVADGEYTYTFNTKAPQGFDATATHSIGVYSSRNLTEFDLGTQFSDNVFNFVPGGAAVTHVRDVVRTTTCNKCHDPLQAHGGSRMSVELCVLCHTPQTADASSGNTVDMKVFIHKIHMGENLPSVQAGQHYQIIGFQNSVNDYSTVVFPAESPANCQFCHDSNAAQADAWLTHPTRAACGSCHDNVNFATGENHVNLPQISDNQCATCHIPQGENEFDASIRGTHTLPRFSTQLPGVVFTLESVANGTAGNKPTVNFTLKDKSGAPLDASTMNLLNLVMAGSTTDYAVQLSEDVRKATTAGGGAYTWTMANAVPANATGTWTIGIEGYRNVNINAGTVQQQTVRDVGGNQIVNFSADGTAVQPRRTVVTQDQCDQCHFHLAAHGTIRNRVEYCVLCHNPNANDASQRPADQGAPQTIDFRTLVHRIHTGENQQSDYSIYGFGRTLISFAEVRFPGDRRDCAKCHADSSWELPLPAGLINVQNPRGFINPEGPTTAACLGCHTDQASAAHAAQNASPGLGEACAVCHGQNSDFAVDRVHAR